MRRWDPLNDRQFAVLRRLAAAEDLSSPADASARVSANALRSRGLIELGRCDGRWEATLTEAGEFYLEKGHHPEHPAHKESDDVSHAASDRTRHRGNGRRQVGQTNGDTNRPPHATAWISEQRRNAALELVERLAVEKSVRVEQPDEATATRWRQVVDFAKQHGLAPDGYRLEKRRQYNGDLYVTLVAGPHANTRRGRDP
ncbi:hypothetical protein [Amycolatopsis palatopharyngis]|uniref:hypothetical protein n=1 Tax=Amycolatopsis palatopharyngis TaxID=187982 RepID=UPI000E2246A5|nr:hypothetical protein [Amycolatopsis palatopharyngis]